MARRRNTNDPNEKPNAQEPNESLEFRTAPKVAQALRLRRLGYTYEQIAHEVGYQTEAGARLAVKKANSKIIREEASALAAWQLDMLDTALQVVMTRIARNDKDSLWAVDRLTPLLKRQAELMGLDTKPDAGDAPSAVMRRYILEPRTESHTS